MPLNVEEAIRLVDYDKPSTFPGMSDAGLGPIKVDMVNHPLHYTAGGIEVLDFIDAWKLGFYEAQIVKYVVRYPLKGGVEDLKKARFYLDRLIKSFETEL